MLAVCAILILVSAFTSRSNRKAPEVSTQEITETLKVTKPTTSVTNPSTKPKTTKPTTTKPTTTKPTTTEPTTQPTTVPQTAPTTEPTTYAPTTAYQGDFIEHVVQANDNYYSILRQYGIDDTPYNVDILCSANNLTPYDGLYIGEIIKVPTSLK